MNSLRNRCAAALSLTALFVFAALQARAETLTRGPTGTATRFIFPAAAAASVQSMTQARRLVVHLKYLKAETPGSIGTSWSYSLDYQVAVAGNPPTSHTISVYRAANEDAFEARNVHAVSDLSNRVELTVTAKNASPGIVLTDFELIVTSEEVTYAQFLAPGIGPTVPTLTFDVSSAVASLTSVTGAEEYDLEWVHIEAGVSPLDPFKYKQPTRVSISALQYRVDLSYPAGKLHLRARAVGRYVDPVSKGPIGRRAGPWSKPVEIDLQGFESARNWQRKTVFSEDGRRQDTATYFDGTFRERQSQSSLQSANAVMIAETKYSSEGQVAARILPAPRQGDSLTYAPRFNLASTGDALQSVHFEGATTAALSTTSGAGQYFSAANPDTSSLSQRIADTEGYPYSAVQYERAPVARKIAESGVGASLRIGSLHDEQHLYGSPSLIQLRTLFGSNAGSVDRFHRNILIDQNRHATVSYVDADGRTVATALTGVPGAALVALDTNSAASGTAPQKTIYLNDANQVSVSAGTVTSIKEITNLVPTSYAFTYQLGGVDYTTPDTPSLPSVCASCKYEVRIKIIRPSGQPTTLTTDALSSLPGAACSTTSPNEICRILGPPTTYACAVGVPSSSPAHILKFSAQLAETGTYAVIKSVTVLDVDATTQIQSTPSRSGFSLTAAINTAVSSADYSSCATDCTSYCELTPGVSSAGVAACKNNCEAKVSSELSGRVAASDQCSLLESALRADVRPGGQWFENDTWLNASAAAVAQGRGISPPASSWRDYLNAEYLKETWTSSWETPLLAKHKEFCHLTACRSMSGSNRYDLEAGALQTYADARTKGYLNPLGMSGIPGIPAAGAALDPYFTSGPGAAFASTMKSWLSNYTGLLVQCASGEQPRSVWEFVANPRFHPDNPNPVPLDAQWTLFRSIYIGLKQEMEAQRRETSSPKCPYLEGYEANVHRPPPLSDPNTIVSQAGESLQTYGNAYCPLRVAHWIDQLKLACTLSDSEQSQVKDLLTQYCEQQIGIENPLGLILPGSTSPIVSQLRSLIGGKCDLTRIEGPSIFETQQSCTSNCCTDWQPSDCLKSFEGVANTLFASTPLTPHVVTPAVFSKVCIAGAQTLNKAYGNGLDIVSAPAPGVTSTCTVAFVDANGTQLTWPNIASISGGEFADVPLSSSPAPAGLLFSNAVVDAKVQTSGSPTLITRKLAVFTNCPMVLLQPQSVTCAPGRSGACTVGGSTIGGVIVGAAKPTPGTIGVKPALGKLLGSTASIKLPAPTTPDLPVTGTCGVIPHADACLREVLSKIDAELANAQAQNFPRIDIDLPYNTCYGALQLYAQTAIVLQRDTKKVACKLALFSETGTIIDLGHVSRLIGGAIHTETLPASFTGTPPPAFHYSRLKLRLRMHDSTELWGYLFVTCDYKLETSCPQVPVKFAFPAQTFPDPLDQCKQAVALDAERSARRAWERGREKSIDSAVSGYQEACATGAAPVEQFFATYKETEHHYVLYYYDQARNLIQTVPPAGFEPATLDSSGAVLTDPPHRMPSRTRFNTANQPIWKSSPDWTAKSAVPELKLWYNDAQQQRFSRDPRQKDAGEFSYVKYDARGRPTETGVVTGITEDNVADNRNIQSYPSSTAGTLSDRVVTSYDNPDPLCTGLSPNNLRGRVASVVSNPGDAMRQVATCYSYDASGNVSSIVQNIAALGSKRLDYEYDVISRKVIGARYQSGQPDFFAHRYTYDADNRLIKVETSRDGELWSRDAEISYFRHGPLARLELGDARVQGLDYTYTAAGWLKAINADLLDAGSASTQRDPGADGFSGSNGTVARDVLGISYGYFPGDYKPIGGSAVFEAATFDIAAPAFNPGALLRDACKPPASSIQQCGLWDGNITTTTVANRALINSGKGILGRSYQYDEIGRLIGVSARLGPDLAKNVWPSSTTTYTGYRETFAYDGNGNFRTIARFRDDDGSGDPQIDKLTYRYFEDANNKRTDNRLLHINDAIAATTFSNDVDDQGVYNQTNPSTWNYGYDNNGALIRDGSSSASIARNSYGKVKSLTYALDGKTADVEFIYDGYQNRIATVFTADEMVPVEKIIEMTVRDEQGRARARYVRVTSSGGGSSLKQTKQFVLAANRLGVWSMDRDLTTPVVASSPPLVGAKKVTGYTEYELASNTGSVLTTILDRKDLEIGSTIYYPIQRLSADYYAYGSAMSDRRVQPKSYPYLYHGMEEFAPRGMSDVYYTLARTYDGQSGRWLSMDPVFSAERSPYSALDNNPPNLRDAYGTQTTDLQDATKTVKGVAKGAYKIGKLINEELELAEHAVAVPNIYKDEPSLIKLRVQEAMFRLGVKESRATSEAVSKKLDVWVEQQFPELRGIERLLERTSSFDVPVPGATAWERAGPVVKEGVKVLFKYLSEGSPTRLSVGTGGTSELAQSQIDNAIRSLETQQFTLGLSVNEAARQLAAIPNSDINAAGRYLAQKELMRRVEAYLTTTMELESFYVAYPKPIVIQMRQQ